DSDPDGDILTAKVLSNPSNGKVDFKADGSFSYIPNPGFAGPDNFTYSVSDGVSPSGAVAVNLTVTNQPPAGQTDNYTIPHTKVFNQQAPGVLGNDSDNQPPAGQTDNYTIPHTKVFNQQAPGVLGNDSDPDGDILTAKVLSNPINGKVDFKADGSFSYTPNAGFATASATEYRRLGLLRSISMSPTSHLLDKQTITVPHLILPSTFLRSQVS
ncbi:MAG: hypothetical protein EAZ25_00015, partial [Oscillatoriales cyanobacterium]